MESFTDLQKPLNTSSPTKVFYLILISTDNSLHTTTDSPRRWRPLEHRGAGTIRHPPGQRSAGGGHEEELQTEAWHLEVQKLREDFTITEKALTTYYMKLGH